jgi:hypothetical protein
MGAGPRIHAEIFFQAVLVVSKATAIVNRFS